MGDAKSFRVGMRVRRSDDSATPDGSLRPGDEATLLRPHDSYEGSWHVRNERIGQEQVWVDRYFDPAPRTVAGELDAMVSKLDAPPPGSQGVGFEDLYGGASAALQQARCELADAKGTADSLRTENAHLRAALARAERSLDLALGKRGR